MHQVERAIFDLRRGLPVLLRDADQQGLYGDLAGENRSYLHAKSARAGHMLDAALEGEEVDCEAGCVHSRRA